MLSSQIRSYREAVPQLRRRSFMMAKVSIPDYVNKVKSLDKEETERLLSRMSGKLPRRLDKNKLSKEEALAIQMELEDEQLEEWRAMMRTLKQRDEAKQAAKTKDAAKTKVVEKDKAVKKAKSTKNTKVTQKTKTVAKSKVAAKAKASAKPKVGVKPKVEAGK
jgi:hypothetical protein